MADTREAEALLTLRRMSDVQFNKFLSTLPPRVQLLVRGRMCDWEQVLPGWYVATVMEPRRLKTSYAKIQAAAHAAPIDPADIPF